MEHRILLISGLHANERCAPIIAEEVHRRLRERHDGVDILRMPYEYTALANIDDPAHAVADHCMREGTGVLDMDLNGLVGDDALRSRFPGAVAFEFHNSRNVWKKFGIDPNKPVEDYEIGPIMPVFTRPYEIGMWRNVLPDGAPGKHVIEVPAVSVPVPPEKVEARLRRVDELARRGYALRGELDIECYLKEEADIDATRARGLLGDCMSAKIADWILSITSGEK